MFSSYNMQAEVPLMPQNYQGAGATVGQLQATANSLQPKLQTAMQQATCSGTTCFSASKALPEMASMPVLRRLQQDIMSNQTAPHIGMHICACLTYLDAEECHIVSFPDVLQLPNTR